MTTVLIIYLFLGALAFRNHYLSINHPEGVYYETGEWDIIDKYFGILLFLFPITFLFFYARPNGYNWRKKDD